MEIEEIMTGLSDGQNSSEGLLTERSFHPPSLPNQVKHRRRRRDKQHTQSRTLITNRETRAAVEVTRSRDCVVDVLKRLLTNEDCGAAELDEKTALMLDACYRIVVDHETHTKDVLFLNSQEDVETVAEEEEDIVGWSFVDSLLFTFTVITTIGYGNVAPRTFEGRLFVIFYGLIGIPFTLLAIADLGKFLSELMFGWNKAMRSCKQKLWNACCVRREKVFRSTSDLLKATANGTVTKGLATEANSLEEIIIVEEELPSPTSVRSGRNGLGKEESVQSTAHSKDDTDEYLDDSQALSLFILFIIYIALGAGLLSLYEPDLDFFKAVYFNFVTLTSIGLGDIVPRSETYMAFTIAYISVGLALTTIAIEIAADTLKRLHYFGRKIENVAGVPIWFGGKKITMRALVRNLGDQFNLPVTVVKELNLDHFVEQAIKVEAGEIETLRPPPFDPEERSVEYVDNTEAEEWIRDPTPSPSPIMTPKEPTPKEPTPKEPTPAPTPAPPPKSPTPAPSPQQPSPIPSPQPPPTATPPPKSPTPVPTPKPPTPVPSSTSPTPVPSPKLPTPVASPKPPTPAPSPKPPTPIPSPKKTTPTPSSPPTQTPSPEPKSSYPSTPSTPVTLPELKRSRDKEEEKEVFLPATTYRRPSTPSDHSADKKRAYSEEALRRYHEYQKQWKKFRQTQQSSQSQPPTMLAKHPTVKPAMPSASQDRLHRERKGTMESVPSLKKTVPAWAGMALGGAINSQVGKRGEGSESGGTSRRTSTQSHTSSSKTPEPSANRPKPPSSLLSNPVPPSNRSKP